MLQEDTCLVWAAVGCHWQSRYHHVAMFFFRGRVCYHKERHDFLGLAIIFNTSRGDVLALQAWDSVGDAELRGDSTQ